MQTDYAGPTVEVIDPQTGEIRQAQIFVAVLAASSQTAMAEKWQRVCTGQFRAEGVPGDHYTLFTEPALSRVVAAIEETLGS